MSEGRQGVSGSGQGRDEDGKRRRRVPKPLDPASLDELALGYVARFATSRAKLLTYLKRKLRERGWAAEEPPGFEALAAKLIGLGFIDDRAFAEVKAGTLTRRGLGVRRVRAALGAAGIGADDQSAALAGAAGQGWTAALRFAERRRLGPWAAELAGPQASRKALAAMLRGGHDFAVARRIVTTPPGEVPEPP